MGWISIIFNYRRSAWVVLSVVKIKAQKKFKTHSKYIVF